MNLNLRTLEQIVERLDRVSHKISNQEEELKRIMEAIDNLRGAVKALGDSISNELSAISTKLASIPPAGTSDADIEAVVGQINALKQTVDQETAALAPPAETPAASEKAAGS